MTTTYEWRALEVCSDCLMAAANGLDSVENYDLDRLREWLDRWHAACEGHPNPLIPSCVNEEHSRNADGESECIYWDNFSMRPCEWCGDRFAGTRHCAAVEV